MGRQLSTTAFATALIRAPLQAVSSPLAADAGVPGWWEPLFESACNRSAFLSAAWMQSWLEVYGRDFKGTWIRWEECGETVGGCLLLTRLIWKGGLPMVSVHVNATGEAATRTPLAEYNDILHVAGHRAAIAADLARILEAMPWSRLLASGYQDDSLLAHLIPLLAASAVEHEAASAPYVDLPALPTPFEATLRGKVGSKIRRNIRRYQNEHGPFQVTRASSLEEAMAFFDELSVRHSARWQSRGQSGSFSCATVRDFHRGLIRRLWSTQGVELIHVGNEQLMVGYLYNFTSEGKVYLYQSGFAYQSDSKLSPGLFAHALAIEHYRERGLREYDFLAGDVQYKRALANAYRTLQWTVVYRDRLWVRAILWLRAARARHLARTKPPRVPAREA